MSTEISVESRLPHTKATTVQRFAGLLHEESGQYLIEYALVFCLVMLGAVASMKSLDAKIATVFAAVGTVLTSAT